MDIMSKFAERLETLMFDHKVTAKQLSEVIGCDLATIYRFLRAHYTPTVDNIVKIADYFHCTVDFLIGKEIENYTAIFYPCPLFSEQLNFLRAHFNCTWQYFYKTAKISPSRFYEWKNGKRIPTLNNIIALADGFNVTIDFILGRTRNDQ